MLDLSSNLQYDDDDEPIPGTGLSGACVLNQFYTREQIAGLCAQANCRSSSFACGYGSDTKNSGS